MSVNIKQSDNTLKKIAGNTILLDATCSEIRSGTFSIQCVGNSGANSSITFETPMSDTDYVVIFESNSPAAGEIGFRNKTTTGFGLYVLGGRGDTEVYTFTGKYYAFRLVELEGYNAIYNKMTNIDASPTDNSTNLVTSGGVYDAIKNASSVFIGTSAEWESETSKTDYQVAILTDKPNVNAVDSTDGSTAIVGEPNKRWVGTQAEWDNLTAAEKAEFEIVCFTDDNGANGKDIYSTTETKTNKVWIDGKKIYRKVVEKNISLPGNSWTSTGIDISEIDTLCNCVMLNSGNSGSDKCAFGGFYTSKSSNQLSVYCVSDANWTVSTFILEYTKIAD